MVGFRNQVCERSHVFISGSSSMEETDTSSEEEDDVDGAPRELLPAAVAVEPEINRPSQSPAGKYSGTEHQNVSL